jgi:3-carboxy-cis,cis-muconate cycloisomerase
MTNDLNSFLFSTPEITRIFSPEAQLRAMMRFEWGLICALESAGIAPRDSAAALKPLLDASFVDTERLQQDARQDGNIAIPFVRQLTSAAKAIDARATRVIHLGATSQDVLDTALVLQMQEAIKILESAIDRLITALAKQVSEHRETILTGRTWLQAGPPTTLGLKLAGTLAAVRRHRTRIEAAADRALVLQFGGAVGTLAALGNAGTAVSAELARVLRLRAPELPWHAQRDGLVEMVAVLANLTGSLSKFARDAALLMQSEVGEASESGNGEGGGSSTMPHKQNPVACAGVIAAHERMPGLVASMLHAMPQEHERGLGLWQAEWETVPEAFRVTAAALADAITIAEGLVVHADRMRSNFDALQGITMAEAVVVALIEKVGRAAAHDLLRSAVRRARDAKCHLGTVLKSEKKITAHLSAAEIDRFMEPDRYLGSAQPMIARVLQEPEAKS